MDKSGCPANGGLLGHSRYVSNTFKLDRSRSTHARSSGVPVALEGDVRKLQGCVPG